MREKAICVVLAGVVTLCLGGTETLGQGFRGLGGSRATEISADGSTVVGYDGAVAQPGARAWRWAAASGLTYLRPLDGGTRAVADGVSPDGSFVVGRSASEGFPIIVEGVRWDSAGTPFSVGPEGGGLAVSANGAVIAGNYYSPGTNAARWTIDSGGAVNRQTIAPQGATFGANRSVTAVVGGVLTPDGSARSAFRWTEAAGVVNLGHLYGGTNQLSEAFDVSDDGRVVVGTSAPDGSTGSLGYQAFRWTEGGGMVGIGDLAGGIDYSTATTVSEDGSIVAGWGNGPAGPDYFLWTSAAGMRPLADVFRDAGLDFEGWRLTAPQSDRYALGWLKMSGDGLAFAGTGINPQGQQEAWVAVVPEPSSAVLAVVCSAVLFRRRRL